jgi:hypothetical protein
VECTNIQTSKRIKGLIVAVVLLVVLAGMSGCSISQASERDGKANDAYAASLHKIAVAVYSNTDNEVRMFKNYYLNYIAKDFPVEFIYSQPITSAEAEVAFVSEAKEQGAEGIISFAIYDAVGAAAACEDAGMYYIIGSGAISDEDFAAIKDNPYFLGVIGPSSAEEYRVGLEMASDFAAAEHESDSRYLLVTGGAAQNNFMHYERSRGMLDGLAAAYGIEYDGSTQEILLSGEQQVIETGVDGVSIQVCPGYFSNPATAENFAAALAGGGVTDVLSVLPMVEQLDVISAAEPNGGHNIRVGVVDCFSEANLEAIAADDAFGNPQIDFVAGKYASMIAPAFAAMYNALEGEAEFLRPNGEAFRLMQSFLVADGRDSFNELYSYTQGIYVNAYSSDDLRQVIRAYNPAAEFEDFAALTEREAEVQ